MEASGSDPSPFLGSLGTPEITVKERAGRGKIFGAKSAGSARETEKERECVCE
jgi:hypothetical protein